MKHISYGKKIIHLAAATALFAGLFVVAMPGRASAAGGLCYDALAGITYNCQADGGSTKVDGKNPPNNKFDKAKCYAFSDGNQGWLVADCNANVFQQTVSIAAPVKQSDDAAAKCLDTGSDVNGECEISCPSELQSSGGCDIVKRYINPAINVLSIFVGLVVVIAIITGGIQYASARDNPQAIQGAKRRIGNALLGFLGYTMLYFFLQWITPGGFL